MVKFVYKNIIHYLCQNSRFKTREEKYHFLPDNMHHNEHPLCKGKEHPKRGVRQAS